MQWLAYAVGAFYVLGGLLVIRAGRAELFLDRALNQITGEPTPLTERVRAAYALGVGLMILAGGVALLAMSRWAVVLFVASLLVQTAYLLWASRALPPSDAAEAKGRRSSINASLIYAAATALVLSLDYRGWLQ
jgi:hypothetical protein